jgi:type II secretory pathway component HofQ
MNADFKNAVDKAIQQLDSLQQYLKAITCPTEENLTVNLRELTSEHIEKLLQNTPSGRRKEDKANQYIYVVRIADAKEGLVAALSKQLDEVRKSRNDNAYCRVNRDNTNTDILYVGRSKTPRTRLRQHLGEKNNGTYSMHLQRWATGNDAKISISYLKFENKSDSLIQVIEDCLWDFLKPVFGKRGAR